MSEIRLGDLFDAATTLARTVRQRRADRRLRRRIRSVPQCRIGELPEDTLGRLSGTVRPFGPVLEAPHREPSGTVLRLAGSPRYPLVISDDPKSL